MAVSLGGSWREYSANTWIHSARVEENLRSFSCDSSQFLCRSSLWLVFDMDILFLLVRLPGWKCFRFLLPMSGTEVLPCSTFGAGARERSYYFTFLFSFYFYFSGTVFAPGLPLAFLWRASALPLACLCKVCL